MTTQKRYDLAKTPLISVLAKELPECSPIHYEEIVTGIRNHLTDGRRDVPNLTSAYTWKPKKNLEIELHESIFVRKLEGEEIYGEKICSKFNVEVRDGKPKLTLLDND